MFASLFYIGFKIIANEHGLRFIMPTSFYLSDIKLSGIKKAREDGIKLSRSQLAILH